MSLARCLGCNLLISLEKAAAAWPDLIAVHPLMQSLDADHEGFCATCFRRIFAEAAPSNTPETPIAVDTCTERLLF